MKKSSPLLRCRAKRAAMMMSALFSAGFGAMASLQAAIYTYDLTNVPSLQNSTTLTGNITIDTTGGTESPESSGNFFVGHSSVIAWNFTVSASGGGSSYSGSSTGINPSATGNGGSFAMYATPTTLTIVSAASLTLQSDEGVPGADVAVTWVYDTPIYYSGGTGVGGQVWLNSDRAALDAAFPVNPDAGANNWTIATAVPEPGMAALLAFGALASARSRRRRS